ncbi:MAG: hypothetical protein KGO81_01530 [Bacteroidota bacterium]|nr:hypothetical protein [Bacteroidota bacterium]
MSNYKVENYILHVLCISVAMCFIGHGSFGIITKPIWCNYFAVFGIDHTLSYSLMPWVGAIDVLLGVIMLFRPMRIIALWLVIWGICTASLRPLSGEPFAELIERAGNFGAPMALLILAGLPKNFKELFSPIQLNGEIDFKRQYLLKDQLRIIVFLLLAGHGWLNLIDKKALLDQYAYIGLSNPDKTALWIGLAEVFGALFILIKPFRILVFSFFVWKMLSELFYPKYELFEWIERGGSYGTLLALLLILEYSSNQKINRRDAILVRNTLST